MSGFQLKRLGLLMEPEPDNPLEAEGILNPAAVRGPDGSLYLFPRLVARNNYSRIGIARVLFDDNGDPYGVERLGTALEPEADYERRSDGSGGCEDPRVTYVEALRIYVMTYTALSPRGPRIALAVSEDLFRWKRLGLVSFRPYDGIEFDGVDNKDASVFPLAVSDPSGQPALALLHRPLFPGTRPEEKACDSTCSVQDLRRESIWLSYRSMSLEGVNACNCTREHCTDPHCMCHFTSHHRLAAPVAAWEQLKIGGGAPPVLCRHGWLMIYHGVREMVEPVPGGRQLCYSAGVIVASVDNPCLIRYRSAQPVLTPEVPQERFGVISNVVFPTGIDRRDDLGTPDRFDVYYGMADNRIGVARLDVPERLPTDGAASISVDEVPSENTRLDRVGVP